MSPAKPVQLKVEMIYFPDVLDNYCYILWHPDFPGAWIIDPPRALEVVQCLKKLDKIPLGVLLTHHHPDHVDGVPELLEVYPELMVMCSATDHPRIKGANSVAPDRFEIFGQRVELLHTPGHSKGHICYHLPDSKMIFVGDLLFSAGCGRLLEGEAKELFASLALLQERILPDEEIYCGHEYTQRNLEFASSLPQPSKAVQESLMEVRQLRAKQIPTLPTNLNRERAINPFLQVESVVGFAKLREQRDRF